MRKVVKGGICLVIIIYVLSMGVAFSDETLEKADALFAQRASVSNFGQAMIIYNHYYFKNKPGFDKAIFIARAYYYYGERYKAANARKAITSYNNGAKWAEYALYLKKEDFQAMFYIAICKLRAGGLKTQIGAVEAVKLARTDFEKLIEKFPDEPLAKRALGNLYREVQQWPVGYRDYEKSEKLLEEAHRDAPGDIEIALEYARTLIVSKKYIKARALLIKISTMEGEPGWEIEAGLEKDAAKELLSKIRGKF